MVEGLFTGRKGICGLWLYDYMGSIWGYCLEL